MLQPDPMDGGRRIRRRWRDRWSRRRRAIVLLLVLVAIVVLSLSAYTACDVMHLHRRATRAAGRQIQARYLADSGVAALMAYLATGGGKQPLVTASDDVDRFRGVLVVAGRDPTDGGGFSIVAPEHVPAEHGRAIRFGVENESGRLNLHAILRAEQNRAGAGQQVLLGLPGMSEEIAAAILDWMDEDDEPRALGAENAYYRQLDPPYSARNGPLHSVEELLLVRGVTPELLFGLDRNRNYRVDPHEQRSNSLLAAPFDGDVAPLGWATYLTIYTTVAEDESETADQPPRVWVNQPDMQQLYDELLDVFGNKQWAMFVVAYRQNGPSSSDPTLSAATDRDLDLSRPGNFTVDHPLDLMGVNVEVILAGDTEPVVLPSPFLADDSLDFYLGELEAKLAIDETPPVSGGVDVMHASPLVMSSLPGMSAAAMDEILARREMSTDAVAAEKPDALWLFREGIVSLDEMRILAPHLQSGGAIYRAQVVGYTRDGKAACRLEVVLDAERRPPRLLLRRDLSHLGRGYSLRELGVDQRLVETWSAGESAGH